MRALHALCMGMSLSVVLAAGCGGGGTTTGGNNSGGENNGQNANDGNGSGNANDGDGGANGGNGNASSGGNNSNSNDSSGANDPSNNNGTNGCTPATCESLAKDCGPVSDGCGGIVECGTCDDGFFCGLNAPNVCGDVTTICTVTTPSCGDYECGLISDGCNSTISCGTCTDSELCGLNEPFKCGALPMTGPETCPSKILSCASVGKQCGKIGNGCGGIIDCDLEAGLGCDTDETCGLSEPNKCGTTPVCQPNNQALACAGKCGSAANGCGGLWACPCATGTCGGAGVPNVCGVGTTSCTPLNPTNPGQTTICAGKCGRIGDGCGGTIDCEASGNGGVDCINGQTCGGGGTPGVCGTPACQPILQATACAGKCGQVSNGCGGVYTCSTCGTGQACGYATPNVCGGPTPCSPTAATTACAGKCGKVNNGCGGVIDCAGVPGAVTCASGTFCGFNGVANTCGAPACTPSTNCTTIGYECGTAPNGCGSTLDCGGLDACEDNETCQGTPAKCVAGPGGGVSTPTCPLCGSIPQDCTVSTPTVLTGRVTTPDGEVGVPNAYVYIMKTTDLTKLPAITDGVASGTCERCEDEELGPVLASGLTDFTGAFRLEKNIPVGVDFLLVVKAGKWRRAKLVPAAVTTGKKCTTIDITSNANLYSRLPANKTDGEGNVAHLPKIAISTGLADEMECVFYKAGISASEFTIPSGAGRMHMYRANGTRMGTGCTCGMTAGTPGYCTRNNNPQRCTGNTTETTCDDDNDNCTWVPPVAPEPTATCTGDTSVADTALFGTQSSIDAYDAVVFDCEGDDYHESAAADGFVREYVNKGGRMFASHFSYTWIYDNLNGPNVATNPLQTGLAQSANWVHTGSDTSDTGQISLANRPHANATKIQTFAKWLRNENSATVTPPTGVATAGTFPITDPRDFASSVNTGTDEWVYREWEDDGDDFESVQQLSFNTPFGADSDNICGRVAYSGFHVSGASNAGSDDYFPCTCPGTTLTAQEKVLLYMLFDLSQCVSTDGPEEPPVCDPLDETTACAGKCGIVTDGCGGTIDCGTTCPTGQVCNQNTNQCVPQCTLLTCGTKTCGDIPDGCGGSINCGTCSTNQICGLNAPNECGEPACTPTADCTGKCGTLSDGCGDVYTCPGCPSGQVCGGGGANVCGPGVCSPLTCAAQNIECGLAGNGCNGTINCGPCTEPGESCGGGGVPSQCGKPNCDPLTCEGVGASCGLIGDGCGGSVNCGDCETSGVCGGDGPNQCGGSCDELTCGDVNANCGLIGDGCGGVVNCGVCPTGQICGAVTPNQCGEGPSCPGLTCADQDAECGKVGDGCGNVLDCGKCTAPNSCGGDGRPNKCGPGDTGCNPLTCESQDAECGLVGDGCGELLNCGGCPKGTCGGDGRPNKCPFTVD